MKTASFSEIISLSLERTRFLLFTRFSFKRWIKWIFIAYLAGALASGGISIGDVASWGSDKAQTSSGAQKGSGEGSMSAAVQDMREAFSEPAMVWMAVGMVTLIYVLILVFGWLAMRFRFVFYNAVVQDTDVIAEPFRRYKQEGNSLFGFYAAIVAVSLVLYAGFGWWGWRVWLMLETETGAGVDPGIWAVIQAYAVPATIFAVIGIAWTIVWHWLIHLIVPMMAVDGSRFREAFPKWAALYRGHVKDFWLFLLVSAGMSIVCGILTGIVFVSVILAFLVAGALIVGILYVVFMVVIQSTVVFAILTALVALPFMICMIAVMFAIPLPVAVLFQSFYVYFLTSLDAGYTILPIPVKSVETTAPAETTPVAPVDSSKPAKSNAVLFGCLIGCGTLVVLFIILAIVTAVALPYFLHTKAKANTAIAEVNVQEMAAGVELYARDHGIYPASEAHLLRGDSPYWTGSLCGEVIGGYMYRCLFSLDSYRIEAEPVEESVSGSGVIRRMSQPGGLNVNYREEYL